jgi:hypothetical protein
MVVLSFSVKTNHKLINDFADVPIIGGIFLFILTFIPAVLLSFLLHKLIPGLQDDQGFTKAMLILLPLWNWLLWKKHIKLYFLFLPAWMLFGGVALVKIILFVFGVDKEL